MWASTNHDSWMEWLYFLIFIARCTIVHSAVLWLHDVRLSVTLVDQDHIGWKSWKLIAWTISPTPSLFVAQTPSTYSQGNMGKFWEDWLEVRWGKEACWSIKAAISPKRVFKIQEKLLWKAYSNSLMLFRTVTSATSYGLLFPKIGGLQPPTKNSIAILSQERVKLRASNLAGIFKGSIRTKVH